MINEQESKDKPEAKLFNRTSEGSTRGLFVPPAPWPASTEIPARMKIFVAIHAALLAALVEIPDFAIHPRFMLCAGACNQLTAELPCVIDLAGVGAGKSSTNNLKIAFNIIGEWFRALIFLLELLQGDVKKQCITNVEYASLFRSLVHTLIGNGVGNGPHADGFADQMLTWIATPAPEVAPDYVKPEQAPTALLNQVMYDLDAIVVAIVQRFPLGKRLAEYDCIANKMLQKMMNLNLTFEHSAIADGSVFFKAGLPPKRLEPRPIIITYATKLPTLRVIPYSPVVLMGIPNLCNKKKVNAAIAREIGRLIFWLGTTKKFDNVPSTFTDRNHAIDAAVSNPPTLTAIAPEPVKFHVYLNRKLQELRFPHWVADGVEQIMADVVVAMLNGSTDCADFAFFEARTRLLERAFYDDMRYQMPPEMRVETMLAIRSVVENLGKDSSGKDIPTNIDKLWRDWDPPAPPWGPKESNQGILGELFGVEVEGESSLGTRYELYGHPHVVTPYLLGRPVPYEHARQEVEFAAKLIYCLLGGKRGVDIAPPPLPSGSLGVSTFFNEASTSSYWNNPANFKDCKNLLTNQEQVTFDSFEKIAGPTKNSALTQEERNWYAVFYAGGWLMQSPGNTGGSGGY